MRGCQLNKGSVAILGMVKSPRFCACNEMARLWLLVELGVDLSYPSQAAATEPCLPCFPRTGSTGNIGRKSTPAKALLLDNDYRPPSLTVPAQYTLFSPRP